MEFKENNFFNREEKKKEKKIKNRVKKMKKRKKAQMMMMSMMMTGGGGSTLPTGTFTYYANDKTTPELTASTSLFSPVTTFPFTVSGLGVGGTIEDNSAQSQAAGCHYTISNLLGSATYLFSSTNSPLTGWSKATNLAVYPRAGQDFNAYYDRKALKFFYDTDEQRNLVVYCADSADIVAHELGHAILDSARPDFWNALAIEIWAFHEAFADICALYHAMMHDTLIDAANTETNNNPAVSSVISRLAEDLGLAIYNLGDPGASPDYLRNAVNNFYYVDPTTLPNKGNDNVLIAESHSFSRLFTGIWWDIFVGIYNYKMTNFVLTPKEATILARDTAFLILINAVLVVPKTSDFYHALCAAMKAVENQIFGQYQSILDTVYNNRGIFLPSIQSNVDVNLVELEKTAIVHKHKHGKTYQVRKEHFCKLKDKNVGIQSNSDLADKSVSIAIDKYVEVDNHNNVVRVIGGDETKAAHAAKFCVDLIEQHKDYGPDDKTRWEIKDEKIVRSNIICSCLQACRCQK